MDTMSVSARLPLRTSQSAKYPAQPGNYDRSFLLSNRRFACQRKIKTGHDKGLKRLLQGYLPAISRQSAFQERICILQCPKHQRSSEQVSKHFNLSTVSHKLVTSQLNHALKTKSSSVRLKWICLYEIIGYNVPVEKHTPWT